MTTQDQITSYSIDRFIFLKGVLLMEIRKRTLILTFFIFISIRSFCCDICGCGLGNYYIGMVPQFGRHFIGFRYQYQSFHTHIANDASQFSNDYFQTVELWGGMNFGKRWQLLGFVPFDFTNQRSDDGVNQKAGLGDVAAIINYSVFNHSSLTKKGTMFLQQLWIGGGLKLPTGKTQIDPGASDLVAIANSQLGSGSTDFMLNAAYTLHFQNWGFTSNATYKINTKSKQDYRFGNRLSSNSFLFYTINSKKISISPNIGFQYEHSNANRLEDQKLDQTGGFSTFGTVGVEASIKKLNFGVNVQNPLAQDLAFGQTKSGSRIMAHVTMSF